MKKREENNHPKAYVHVIARGLRIDYTVHVARLKAAVNGAWRRYPDATYVEASREKPNR